MKGIDILINCLVAADCPRIYGLKDINREPDPEMKSACIHGSPENFKKGEKCKECFKKAIESEYDQEGEDRR